MTDLTPGAQYRDTDGDIWTVHEDGKVWCTAPEHRVDPEYVRFLRNSTRAEGCPDYYMLPNGVEVKAVARYLTSNAGQAVQYIARSSRLDGNNKGDRVGDLRKAVDMMLDEIERLEAEEDAA